MLSKMAQWHIVFSYISQGKNMFSSAEKSTLPLIQGNWIATSLIVLLHGTQRKRADILEKTSWGY